MQAAGTRGEPPFGMCEITAVRYWGVGGVRLSCTVCGHVICNIGNATGEKKKVEDHDGRWDCVCVRVRVTTIIRFYSPTISAGCQGGSRRRLCVPYQRPRRGRRQRPAQGLYVLILATGGDVAECGSLGGEESRVRCQLPSQQPARRSIAIVLPNADVHNLLVCPAHTLLSRQARRSRGPPSASS